MVRLGELIRSQSDQQQRDRNIAAEVVALLASLALAYLYFFT
jgi:hypothetical protein